MIPIPLVDLNAQYQAHRAEIDAAIARVIGNSSFIMGPEVGAFETAFAGYCGCAHAVGMASGTAALELALRAWGIGPGDEVITTPFTFIATAEAISQVGALPVFADVDPETYNLDPAAVERAITPRTRAIIAVHLYGQPAEMDALRAIARQRRLKLLEDAAQAHGADYRGRRVGGLADAATFSFYPAKNLGAYGDGGAVVTDDDELAARLRKLRDHGRTSKYVHDELGFAHRLDALQAAILAAKLPHLDDWNEARRRLAARYDALLADTDLTTPFVPAHVRPVYYMYVIRTPRRDQIMTALQGQGIGVGVHYPLPLHLQPAYRHLGLGPGSFPHAEGAAAQVLSLPLFPEMTTEQQDRVVAALQDLVV